MSHPAVDPALLRELAALSRLRLAPDQEGRALAHLARILQAFAALRTLPTEGVEATPYPLPLDVRLRPDEPGPCMGQDQVLANAPAVAGGFFLVPRTVEG